MTKMRLMLNALAVLGVCLICSSLAQAQATRTWVSGVGDDANPCSRTAPCKTFAGAISKTAINGEINVLDPGGFGAVTITKAITIRAVCVEAGVLVSGTNGIIVAAGASDTVTLQGLDINGLNTGISGIKFQSGGTLNVENCYIYEFTQNGIDITLGASGNATIKNCVIRQCGGSGISATTSAGNLAVAITHTDVDKCPQGISAAANSVVTIGSCNVVLCGTNGLNTASSAQANITDSLFANDGTGVNIVAGATVRLNNNVFANDGTGVANAGTGVSPASNNKFVGNLTDRSGAAFVTTGSSVQ